jgi:hypothetical protein
MNIAPVPSFAMRLKAGKHIREGKQGSVAPFLAMDAASMRRHEQA